MFDVPVRVLGTTGMFTFHLFLLDNIYQLDRLPERVNDVTADVSFLGRARRAWRW